MIAQTKPSRSKTIVVIGNGMVGHRFVERLVEFDTGLQYQIVAFCEEPRPAYNRVNLTKFFEYKDSGPLMMAKPDWYHEKSVSLYVGDRAVEIDRSQRIVRSRKGAKSNTIGSCWRLARPRLFRRSQEWTSRAFSSTARSKICKRFWNMRSTRARRQ